MVETGLGGLPPHSRELAEDALALMDGCFDEATGLLRSPGDDLYQLRRGEGPVHLVRESALHALGLLMRHGPGDDERAVRVLEAVLAHQYDEPEAVFHGTWARAPQEAHPPPEPTEWRDYDPNWREFIATTLSLVLDDFADRLPARTVAAIDVALQRAIAGTLRRDVGPRYTNIALMRAYLLDYGGRRLARPEWSALAEEQARAVHALFAPAGTFEEYNSPTYYGVNLYALALWRRGAGSPVLRELGAQMEAALWSDVARFHHAGLKNLCGPFDRAYDMDMTRYWGYLGLWVWDVVGRTAAPVPPRSAPPEHAWDLCPGVAIALLGSRAPAEAVTQLAGFDGERTVRRTISTEPERVATAWLGEHLMIGGQRSSVVERRSSQYHPATAHWRAPDGRVGWLRARGHGLGADAGPGRLSVSSSEPATDELVWEVGTAVDPAAVQARRWQLPGADVAVSGDAVLAHVRVEHGSTWISYRRPDGADPGTPLRMELVLEPTTPADPSRLQRPEPVEGLSPTP